MKIALIGASGRIGGYIAAELSRRGHHVTGLVRRPPVASASNVTFQTVDVFDQHALVNALRGHTVMVSAYRSPPDSPFALVDAVSAMLVGAKSAKVGRFLLVGGAGNLEIQPGVRIADMPDFPAPLRDSATAHQQVLNALRRISDIKWTVISPAENIVQGDSTGTFRIEPRGLLVDRRGQSTITYGDFALAFTDEVEQGRHPNEMLGTGY